MLPMGFRRILYNTVNRSLITRVNKTHTMHEEGKTRWAAISVGRLRQRRGGF